MHLIGGRAVPCPAIPWPVAKPRYRPNLNSSSFPAPDGPETRQARRAAVAVGIAPPTVLAGLLAVVAGLIDPDTALLLFAVCATWLVVEMYRYLQLIEPLPDPEDRPVWPGR